MAPQVEGCSFKARSEVDNSCGTDIGFSAFRPGACRLWRSLDEYLEWCHPEAVGSPDGLWRHMRLQSALERAMDLARHLGELENTTARFQALWERSADVESERQGDAWRFSLDIAAATEQLYLYCEPMAKTRKAADLRGEMDVYQHWQRYSGHRLRLEVPRLLRAAEAVITEVHEYVEDAGSFVVEPTRDLPSELREYFAVARHAFSVELDELGALAALRGLESTLRTIVAKQRIRVSLPNKPGSRTEPLHELDLYQVIEGARRLKWANNRPVLAPASATLLHVLRHARNVAAHSSQGEDGDWREVARMAARHAAFLWKASGAGRRRIRPSEIEKTWV